MPEQTRPTAAPERGGGEDAAALREEIAWQREEILRLRDLLIAKNAELGVAKGALKELAEHSARLTVALRAVRARLNLAATLRRAVASLRRRG